MLFNTLEFGIFFAVVLAVCATLKGLEERRPPARAETAANGDPQSPRRARQFGVARPRLARIIERHAAFLKTCTLPCPSL